MNNIILILISVVAIIIVLSILLNSDVLLILGIKKEQFPYKKKEFLLNIPERRFFEELKKIIPENYAVFPQMQLSSIVCVSINKTQFWKFHNKIDRINIDFVIFEKPYYRPVIAIEYDGKTHEQPVRAKRDLLIAKILDCAGIKNFHVKHQPKINFEAIKIKIEEILSNPENN
jgi:hypothetical protein